MAKEFSLSVIIKVVDKVTSPIRKIGKAFTAGLGRSVSFAARTIRRNMRRMILGVTALTAAGIYMAKRFVTAADVIGKTADNIGITTAELQKLRFAFEQNGLSVMEADKSLMDFSRRLGEAKGGVGEGYDALKELRIGLMDSNGEMKTTRELFDEVADKIAGMTDATKKADLLYGLFGRSGKKLVRMFSEGSKGIESYGQRLAKFGGITTEKAIRRSEKFNDAINLLKKTLFAFAMDALEPILPHLTSFTDKLSALAGKAREMIRQNIGQWIKGIDLSNIGDAITDITERIKDLLVKVKQVDFTQIGKDIEAAFKNVDEVFGKIARTISKIESFAGLFDIGSALDWYKDKLKKAFTFEVSGPGFGNSKTAAQIPATTAKTQADINIRLSAEPGTSAAVGNIRKKGDSKVNIFNAGYLGNVMGAIP